MARVLALIPDLLFGSRQQGSLSAAGHEVELIGDEGGLRKRLADAAAPAAEVLVVDLTNEDLDGARIVESLSGEGELGQTRTLGFFSHVDVRARERAEQAGFDLVVPRSRMAREAPELVARLAADPAGT
jgi:DNA-binding NarL/FixJ family response regulator